MDAHRDTRQTYKNDRRGRDDRDKKRAYRRGVAGRLC